MIDPFDLHEWARFGEWNSGRSYSVDAPYVQERAERGRQLGISAWDYQVLDSFACPCGSQFDEKYLTSHSFGHHGEEQPELAAKSIRRCLEMGWIQRMNQEQIRQLHQELVESGYAMPKGLFGNEGDAEYDWTRGQMTFTPLGWKTIEEFWSSSSEATKGSDKKWLSCGRGHEDEFIVYGASMDAIALATEFYEEDAELLATYLAEQGIPWPDDSGPKLLELKPSGRWCDRWYQRFESGYRARFWQRPDPRLLEDSQSETP